MRPIGFGFSSCPNDTFMFHALVSGLVPTPGLSIEPVIEDIEALNRRAMDPNARLGLTKLSLPAFSKLQGIYDLLEVGAALGLGVGPLVVGRSSCGLTLGALGNATVAVPGRLTTANLLLRLYAPAEVRIVEARFDRIMDLVEDGSVDAGVVIHEGRFTYSARGLEVIADLGALWESREGLPLALGVIGVARTIAGDAQALSEAILSSIQLAHSDPAASREFVRSLAQELTPEVIDRHIALYVTPWSSGLGAEGHAAVDRMLERGREVGGW